MAKFIIFVLLKQINKLIDTDTKQALMRKLLLTYKFLFLLAITAYAQTQNHYFDKLTTKDGLSQNDVVAIYQDYNGFIWLGTKDGLDRYDGNNFVRFSTSTVHPQIMSSNLVSAIGGDKSGKLYIGTDNNGLNVKNQITGIIHVLSNIVGVENKIGSNTVKQVEVVGEGKVWISSNESLSYYNHSENSKTTTYYANPTDIGLPGFEGIYLASDAKDNLWIATENGVYKWEHPNKAKVTRVLKLPSTPNCLIHNDNKLFLALEDGIYCFELASEKLTKLNSVKANTLLHDKRNNLWTGTNNGLYKLLLSDSNTVTKQFHFVKGNHIYNISSNKILSLYEDNEGLIWIGTHGGGVNIHNPNRPPFSLFNKDMKATKLQSNGVSALYFDKIKNLWLGTDNGDVHFLDKTHVIPLEDKYKTIDISSKPNRINTFCKVTLDNKQHIVLIGHDQGISAANKHLLPTQLSEINSPVNAIIQDNWGVIWVATSTQGIIRFDPLDRIGYRNFTSKNSFLLSNHVTCLYLGSKNTIWIGTEKGLWLVNKEHAHKFVIKPRAFFYEEDKHSLSYSYITTIVETADKKICIGTNGGGLNILTSLTDSSAIFEHIKENDGLSNSVIKAILEDKKGNLWVSTNRGINKVELENKKIEQYTIEDGLQDYEFFMQSCAKLSGGRMIFGGVNGFNVFNPLEIKPVVVKPNVCLTKFQIGNLEIRPRDEVDGMVILNKTIHFQQKIELKHHQNSISFEFSPILFSSPLNKKAKYRLLGFDKGWSIIENQQFVAKYTNLPSGEYEFQVMAANSNGEWSNSVKSTAIIIHPHFAKTAPMIALYVLVIIGIIVFFTRYSFIRVQQKNKLKMDAFEVKTLKEVNAMKLRFFTNISHEFRTPLSLIIGPLEELLNKDNLPDKESLKRILGLVYRNSNILMRLINQLMDFRKAESKKPKIKITQTDLKSFISPIYESFLPIAKKEKIEFKLDYQLQDSVLHFDSQALEKVIYNLLSNSFKHTQADGEIQLIILDIDNGFYEIRVKDNGSGIPEEKKPFIFQRFYHDNKINALQVESSGIGLSYCKTLVEAMEGFIGFESHPNVQTTFWVKLPKKPEVKADEVIEATSGYSKQPVIKELIEKEDFIVEETQTKTPSTSILIVEDNIELRTFLSGSLQKDYIIYEAADGELGIEQTLEKNPDLIISDIMMPNMDGIEMTKSLKTKIDTCHIPIILLTAKSSVENQIEGYEIGIEGYIPKPFNLELLRAKIKSIFKDREHLKNTFRKTIEVFPSEVAPSNLDEKFLHEVLQIVEKNIENPEFTIKQLAADCGMSQTSFTNKIINLTGLKPKLFVRNVRLKRAAQLVKLQELTISEIAYQVGFNDPKYFRSCFKEEFGVTPGKYQKLSQ